MANGLCHPDTKKFCLSLFTTPLKPLNIHFFLSLSSSPLQPGHSSQSCAPEFHAKYDAPQEESLGTDSQGQGIVEENAPEQEQPPQDKQVGLTRGGEWETWALKRLGLMGHQEGNSSFSAHMHALSLSDS